MAALREYEDSKTSDASAAVEKFKDAGKAANSYKHNQADQQVSVDYKNLTEDQRKELTIFAVDMVNQIRQAFGTAPMLATPKALEFSKRITEEAYNDANWDAFGEHMTDGKGHNVDGMINIANDMDAAGWSENMGGSLQYWTRGSNGLQKLPIGPQTMDSLKKALYDTIVQMMFDDAKSKWGHAWAFATFDSGTQATMGVDFDKYGYSHFNMAGASDSNGFADSPYALSNTDELKQQLQQAQTALTTAQNNLASKQTAATQAQNELAAAQDKQTAAENSQKIAQNDLQKVQAAVAQAQAKLTAAQQTAQDAQTALDQAQAAQKEAQAKVDALNADLQTKQAQLDQAKAALDTARKVLDEKNATLKAANDNLTDTQEALADAQSTLTDARNKAQSFQQQLQNLAGTQDKLTQAQKNYQAAQAAVTQAQADLNEKQKVAQMAAEALKQAQTEAQNKQTDLQTTQQALAAATDQVTQANDTLQTAQTNLATRKAALAQAQQDTQAAQANLATLQQLPTRLQQAQDLAATKATALANAQQNYTTALAKFNQVQKLATTHEQAVAQAQADLAAAVEKRAQAQAEYDAALQALHNYHVIDEAVTATEQTTKPDKQHGVGQSTGGKNNMSVTPVQESATIVQTNKQKHQAGLPHTGQQVDPLTTWGALLVALGSLFGLAVTGRKKEE